MLAYQRHTGERLWVLDVTADGAAQSFHGELMRVDDELLVASDPEEGHVYRLDAATGEVRWKWPSLSGVSSDLRVLDGRVLVVTLDNELAALDLTSGALLWHTDAVPSEPIVPILPSPVVWDGQVLFPRADGRLSAHDPVTGEVHWAVELEAGITADPLLLESGLLLGLADGRLVLLEPADGTVLHESILGGVPTYRWFPAGESTVVGLTGVDGPERLLVGVDATTLELRWDRFAPDGLKWTSAQPAVHDGLVLVGSTEPALHAVDPATGEMLWTAATDVPPRTVSGVGTTLYVGTVGGMLYAVRLGPLENRPPHR